MEMCLARNSVGRGGQSHSERSLYPPRENGSFLKRHTENFTCWQTFGRIATPAICYCEWKDVFSHFAKETMSLSKWAKWCFHINRTVIHEPMLIRPQKPQK